MSVESDWLVVAKSGVKPGVASLPRTWWDLGGSDSTRFVRLTTSDGRSEALEIEKRAAASGNQVWVAPGTLDLAPDARVECAIGAISDRDYRLSRVLKTRSGRLAILGLLLAALGIVLDSSLKVGAAMESPLVPISPQLHAGLLIVGTALQLVGVTLVFVRGVWLRPA